MATIHLSKEAFKKVVYDYESNPGEWKFEGRRPALVDFFATWCGPCKRLAPMLEELSEDFADRIDIYKVDVDEAEEIATLFGVRSVPTLLFVRPGGMPQMASGVVPKQELKAMIEEKLL